MKSSYVYSPLPKKLLINPEETYYNPFKEIKVFNRATGAICICKYISFCTPNFQKTSKDLFKIIYYNKLGLIKFEETCYGDEVIKRLSQLKGGIIDLRAL